MCPSVCLRSLWKQPDFLLSFLFLNLFSFFFPAVFLAVPHLSNSRSADDDEGFFLLKGEEKITKRSDIVCAETKAFAAKKEQMLVSLLRARNVILEQKISLVTFFCNNLLYLLLVDCCLGEINHRCCCSWLTANTGFILFFVFLFTVHLQRLTEAFINFLTVVH